MADDKSKIKELEEITGVEKDKYEELDSFLARISKKEKDLTDSIKERVKELKKELGLMQEISAVSEHNKKVRKQEIDLLKEKVESEENIVKKMKANLELLKLTYDDMKRNKDVTTEELDQQQKLIKLQEEKIKNVEKLNVKFKETLKITTDLGQRLAKVGDSFSGGLGGKLLAPMTSFQGALSAISDAVYEVITRQKDFASTIGASSKQIGIDLFNMGESMSGVNSRFKNLGGFGIDIKNVADSYKSLYTSMSAFSNLDKATQMNISRHTSLMKNFGISSETAGKNYDILTKSLRVSGNQVTDFSDRLMRHAQGSGIAPKRMVEEFAQAAPRLAVYGKQAEEVFIKLQKQAKSLGVEMSTLTSIVGEQFDTFEGSARAAGRLNAILGGNYLNSVEMLNASEEERVMLIKQALDASGKSFDSMEKYEKKAVAASLGITDMATASSVLGSSTREVQKDMDKQASTQKELVEAMRAAADPMGAISASLDGLRATLAPVAETFNKFLLDLAGGKYTAIIQDFTNGIIKSFEDLVTKVVLALAGLYIIKPLIGPIFKGIFSIIASGAKKIGSSLFNLAGSASKAASTAQEAATSTTRLSQGMSNAGNTAGSSAKNMLAFGGAVLMIGIGIGLAAYGMAQLVLAFQELNPEQQTAALMAMGIVIGGIFLLGLVAVIAAAYVGWAPLLAVGAAFLMIGIGVGIAAFGMSKLVLALKDFKPGELSLDTLKLSGAFGAFAIVLGLLAAAAFFAAPALEIFSLAMLALSVSVGIITVGIGFLVESIGNMFEKMSKGGEGAEKFGTAFSNLINNLTWDKLTLFARFASSVEDIADSSNKFSNAMNSFAGLNSFSDTKIEKFTNFFTSLNGLMWNTNLQTSSSALTQAIKSISESVEAIPENKKLAIESVINTVNRASTITPEQLKPAHDFVVAMTNYHLAQTNSKTASDDAVVQALRESTRAITGELRQGRGQQANNVNINMQGSRSDETWGTKLRDLLHGLSS